MFDIVFFGLKGFLKSCYIKGMIFLKIYFFMWRDYLKMGLGRWFSIKLGIGVFYNEVRVLCGGEIVIEIVGCFG